MSSLLLMSIGPVQEFIASARRSQDFWYGSYLLSQVAVAAARALREEAGADALVFPGPKLLEMLEKEAPGDSAPGAANKILARIPGDLAAARSAGERAEGAARDKLQELATHAFDRAARTNETRAHFHRDVAEAQVRDLLEILWVGVEEGANYRDARGRAEALLNARKATKVWQQPSWTARAGHGVPKSSLDGVRESVIDERLYERAKRGEGDLLYRSFRAHPSERLCGVALLKRLGQEVDEDGDGRSERFFSTSHVAALPFMLGLVARPDDAVKTAFAELSQVVGRELRGKEILHGAPLALPIFGRCDGQLFFETRIDELAEEASTLDVVAKARAERVKSALERFSRQVHAAPPSPYYAMILADGDRMGAAIDAQSDFRAHQALSDALLTFASGVRKTVEGHHGSLVYAGGDDVWALLPVHRAIPCARVLATDFATLLGPFSTKLGEAPSLSVGVVIAHHLEPLDEVRRLAQNAERLAKVQRNALAVILSKRGGSDIEIHDTWDTGLDRKLDLLARLHRQDRISDKAGYELAALERLYRVPGLPAREREKARTALAPVLEVEARRILARKQPRHGEATSVSEDDLELLHGELADPDRLGRMLVVARFLADVAAQAEGSKVEVTS